MNYYEILEVSPNASQEVIKAAYKSLMQRYHPDRNPGNAETAEHASLVVQAYEILSDSSMRAAYDIEIKQQPVHLNDIPGKSRVVPATSTSVNKGGDSYWFAWLLIVLIIVSGWYILSPSKNQQSPEEELKEIRLSFERSQLTPKQMQAKINRIDEIFREHPEIKKREASARAKEVATRTIPKFILNLTVKLNATDKSQDGPGKSPGISEHVLSIPTLGVIVGSFDSEKFIKHIEANNQFISQKLADHLAGAKYEKLGRNDGEQYLKSFILDSIGEITGTNRFEDYPPTDSESPGRYGVIDVLLPESFSVY